MATVELIDYQHLGIDIDVTPDHWLYAMVSSGQGVAERIWVSGPRLIVVGNLADNAVNLPPEYVPALKWNLAQWYRASYQMPEDEMINKMARRSLNIIRLANTQVPTLTMPASVRKSSGVSYNYRSDIP